MKTMKIILVSLLMAGGLILNTFYASSQDMEKDLTRQERKFMRKAQLEANFNLLDSLLNSNRFVLVADFLQNKWGDRISVVQTINFIKVNGETGVLQTGSNSGLGYNGIGGITAEGTIGDMQITRNFKNLSYTLRFSLATQIGHYDVVMSVSAGNYATATISGTTSDKLTWIGHLEDVDFSKVYKGRNTI
jgi:hypothetical protein